MFGEEDIGRVHLSHRILSSSFALIGSVWGLRCAMAQKLQIYSWCVFGEVIWIDTLLSQVLIAKIRLTDNWILETNTT